MKIVSFTSVNGRAREIGILDGAGNVIALSAFAADLPFDAGNMLSLIEAGDDALAAIAKTALSGSVRGIPLADVTLCAPVPNPRKNIVCVGWNYLDHFNEGAASRTTKVDLPDHPTFFTKAPTTLNGPFAGVPAHTNVTEKLDWEVELALVIGRRGSNITEADALSHVFGYMVANDVSAREIQRRHGQQWFKGKSLDGHLPMGPWLTTADEVADPQNMDLMSKVNGVVKQQSNTHHMYFKIPTIISELSQGMTIEPGDIILTGTPSGVGHARTPPEFMKVGDVLETEISGLGAMRNVIVD